MIESSQNRAITWFEIRRICIPARSCFDIMNVGNLAAMFADDTFSYNFSKYNVCILIQIGRFFPWGLNNNTWTLVQVMAGCRTDDKPLANPIIIKFAVASLHHHTTMDQPFVFEFDNVDCNDLTLLVLAKLQWTQRLSLVVRQSK